MKSSKRLMTDHEIILEALRILNAMTVESQRGHCVSTDDIYSLLSFLRDFADGCHHVKEEAIFFPALMQAGMPIDEGPLLTMNEEHLRGRALSVAMQDAVDRRRMDEFVKYAGRYVELLSKHIDKENWVLFEKADQLLNDDEDEKTVAAFDHFETTIVGALALERLRKTIDDLASKYLAAHLASGSLHASRI